MEEPEVSRIETRAGSRASHLEAKHAWSSGRYAMRAVVVPVLQHEQQCHKTLRGHPHDGASKEQQQGARPRDPAGHRARGDSSE